MILRSNYLFDGNTFSKDGCELRLAGDQISAVSTGNSSAEAADTTILDFGDATIIPGLIDAHVHLSGRRSYDVSDRVLNTRDTRVLRASNDCSALLAAGYTTVRDVGSEIALSLAEATKDGLIPGPRIVAAGPIISQTGGHADHSYYSWEDAHEMEGCLLADGIDECRRAVRKAVRAGAELIKICTTGGIGSKGDGPHDAHFTYDEVAAIVDEAHRLKRRVAAHAQGTSGILTALRGGVDTIEHGTYIDEECINLFRETGAMLVPTVALWSVFRRTQAENQKLPPWRLAKQARAIDAIERGFKLALNAAIPIACGSDFTGVPMREHGNNSLEPITMVELGASPQIAMSAATSGAAKALGLENLIGRISSGMQADLVVVRGNLEAQISSLENPVCVIQGGQLVHSGMDYTTK